MLTRIYEWLTRPSMETYRAECRNTYEQRCIADRFEECCNAWKKRYHELLTTNGNAMKGWVQTHKENCSLRLAWAKSRKQVSELTQELAIIETDIQIAAGELLVPAPRPGTDMAKLLHANIMMRKYQIPRLEEAIEKLVDAIHDEDEKLPCEMSMSESTYAAINNADCALNPPKKES